MQTEQPKLRVAWYRSPLTREQLKMLNRRSDIQGFIQTLGYLGVLAITGLAVVFSAGRVRWPIVVLLVFLHGTCWAFLANGFHELLHDSVFKTRALNKFFMRVLAFLGWHNPHMFWASHTEHHKYTLHPPDDQEVVLPAKLTRMGFLTNAFISYNGIRWGVPTMLRVARGRINPGWEQALFPESDVEGRRRVANWARIVLVGHSAIVIASIVMHWWMVPVVITLAPFYGGGLQYLCNNCQHVGLQDNVPDFRLCCRTVILNPFLSFLYWQMNYHTEHHMYAAVPCYNLRNLHRIIEPDMPRCPRGLRQAWKQINAILARQKEDPTYQYIPELPGRSMHVTPEPKKIAPEFSAHIPKAV